MNYKNAEDELKGIATLIDEYFKALHDRPIGFALLVFDFDAPEIGNYIGNCNREDMIKALRETAARLEKNEYIPATKGEA